MIDHLHHIRTDTATIIGIASGHDPTTPVPTCGDWSLADLTWHIGEVQDFWAWIVSRRAADPSGYPDPQRPPDAELAGFLRDASDRLVAALDGADPADGCWSWASDHTVGFTFRRQTHEALIHRVDAELAVGIDPVLDPEVASDGVDEMLAVFLSDIPEWGTFRPDNVAIALIGTDTHDAWTYRFGRMTGTSPESGRSYDVDALIADADASPAATINAPVAELDLWLWGRGAIPTSSGDRSLLERLRNAAIAE